MSRAILKFYLNNQLVGAANNWDGISMSLDFNNDGDGPFVVQPEIQTDSIEFVLNESNVIRQYIQDGADGVGPGIYEPMELRIDLASGGSNQTAFEGILDMVNDMQFIDKNKVLIKLVKKGGLNQLTERTQAFSFAFLFAKGEITASDFVKVKYILAHIPNFEEVLLISISIFILVKEIAESVMRITSLIVDIAAAIAGGISGSLAGILLLIGRAIIEIIYTIIISLALRELMKDLIDNLVAKERVHLGMPLDVLLQKGAEHIGYTFESTQFNDPFFKSLIILPVKEDSPNILGLGETGFPTNKGGLYTYFDMLQFYKQLINGKIVVRNNKIIIERRDFFDKQTTYVIRDARAIDDQSSFNADEIQANLNIQFLLDEQDDTTLINYRANNTTFQKITEAVIVVDKQNVQIKGLQQVNLPVSLPTRKSTLTVVEKLLLRLAKKVDKHIGGNVFSKRITGRFGALSLANDFTGVPKLIPVSNQKVPTSYRTTMSAKVLHDKYYFIDSFTIDPNTGENRNQYRRHVGVTIPFCFEDYVTLSENPGFTTKDGREGKFEKIEGNPNSGSAVVDIRIKEVFTRNLKDTIV